MMMLITAAALAAGQPATAPAPMPASAPMQMPAGHDMSMTQDQHAAMKEKCCCKEMGDEGHDQHAPSTKSDHDHK